MSLWNNGLSCQKMERNVCSIVLCLFLALVLTASCEKGYYLPETEDTENMDDTENTEKTGDTEKDNDSDDEGKGDDNSESDEEEMLTVAQFMEMTLTGQHWVAGYVVGACTKTINNADFEPPFENPQALLLADTYGETDKEKVIAIGLPSGSKARRELNLVDHPEIYGKRIKFYGEQTTYLKVKGMKKPNGWKIIGD